MQKTKKKIVISIPTVLIIVGFIVLVFGSPWIYKGVTYGIQCLKTPGYISDFEERIDLLKPVVEEADLDYYLLVDMPENVIFCSVTDAKSNTYVFHSGSNDFEEAWEGAVTQAEEWIQQNHVEAVDVIVDKLCRFEAYTPYDLSRVLNRFPDDSLVCGVALDDQYTYAFLDSEVRSFNGINYEDQRINWDNFVTYAESRNIKDFPDTVPALVNLFQTAGWSCDANHEVTELDYYGANS